MIADQILKERYYQEGEDWAGLCRRVAHAVAQGKAGEGMEEVFYQRLLNKEFLPNSPTLMNAGISGTLSACFTIAIEDDMESIFDAVKEGGMIGKYGGGFGVNLSKIRPKGSKVGSTNGVASGPVSFLQMFNTMADTVKQGGRRRIAMMAILDVTHPDIEEFILAKTNSDKLNNMNMSVMIPNSFMEAVSNNESKAVKIWNLIVKQAWTTGEPGILFYDRINQDNIIPEIPIRETNPCAEEPMIPYSSCNLISIDVGKLVDSEGNFKWNKYERLIEEAVKFADATIDVNVFPLDKIRDVTTSLRPIGVGIMGFAYALIKQGIIYGSKESFVFAEKLTSVLKEISDSTSCKLAEKYGSFPACEKSILPYPRRNAYLNSIAPTGTISTIAETSFGIEPLFSISYTRHVIGKSFKVVDPLFKEMIIKEGLDLDKIINLIVDKPTIQDIKEIPLHIRKLFVTAHDITPFQHVSIVAACQGNIDTGISKTINMPKETTLQDVDAVFKQAYTSGCKGITIYRNGSRDAPIKTEAPKKIVEDYKAPDITFGPQERISVACGHFLCSVTGVDEQPLKIINNATTGCCDANLQAIQRVCSLALRSGISPKLLTEQLDKVVCNACVKNPNATSKSCAAGISKVIKLYDKFYKAVGSINLDVPSRDIKNDKGLVECPNCNEKYVKNTKCGVCPHCGYSKCS